jgi:hypothetical protein
MLVGVLALIFAAIDESIIWFEKRKFIAFHDGRAQYLLDRAAGFSSRRPEVSREYRRLAAWHVERANGYRRAHKTHFSDEIRQDFRQTELEQSFERALTAGGAGGKSAPLPAAGD